MMPFDAQTQDSEDAALLAAFAAGDASAARILVSRFGPMVYSVAFRMLNNAAEAEDVSQEVMTRLWQIAPKWDADRAKVSTWLYRVTNNQCIDRLRKSKRMSGDEVPEVADDTPSVDRKMADDQRRDALQAALDELPERQKQVIVLRQIEGLPNPEIAAIMDTSVEAVESLSSRAKRALAKILAPKKSALGLIDHDT